MPDPNITQIIDREGFRLPNWVDLQLWHEFLNTRAAKGKKLSHHSKRQHLEELKKSRISIKMLSKEWQPQLKIAGEAFILLTVSKPQASHRKTSKTF